MFSDPLALTCDLHADETTASFVSRLAARNGFGDADTFCRHFFTDFARVVAGDEEALATMAALAGVAVDRLHTRLVRSDESRHTLNGHEVRERSLECRHLRYCRQCLDEDIATHPNLLPHVAAYGRWQWYVIHVRTCRRHGRPLEPMPYLGGHKQQDFACHLRSMLDQRAFGLRPTKEDLHARLRSMSRLA